MTGTQNNAGASGCAQAWPDVLGMELDAALLLLGEQPEVERAIPPRGLPCERGVWRVVRAEAARGRITAAFFPAPEAEKAQEEQENT